MFLRSLFLFVFFVPCFSMQAQGSGYLGKKFIFKTNLINGLRFGFSGGDVEFLAWRGTSLIASAHYLNYDVPEFGISSRNGIVVPRDGSCELNETVRFEKGNTNGLIFSVGIRHYFNRVLAAPSGFYVSFEIGQGRVNLSGFKTSYEYEEAKYTICDLDEINFPLRPDEPDLTGVAGVTFIEFPGLGYQTIIARIVSLDFKFSIQGHSGQLPEQFLRAADKNYFIRGNTISGSVGKLNIGPAVYVKFGLLLF